MRKFILASASAIPLLGVAACSDNTDATTTQSTTPQTEEVQPAAPQANQAPSTGTGGDMQTSPDAGTVKPAEPAPAQ